MTRTTCQTTWLTRSVLLVFTAFFLATPALAECPVAIAGVPTKIIRLASANPADFARLASLNEGEVRITFLGHASFLLESPGGVSVVTDYNGHNRAPFVPDIVTMNHAHTTHYTDSPEPGIKQILRGWNPTGNGPAIWDYTYRDVRIRNLPTNTRDWSGNTVLYGNSVFVFEMGDLCIAHLGHLHHVLLQSDLDILGRIDVLLAPIDDGWTMNQEDVEKVIEQLHPPLVIPMHYMFGDVLDRFLTKVAKKFPAKRANSAEVVLTRQTLPTETEFLILRGF